MRNVIPQNIKEALQDLPDGLQKQVLEYLDSVEQTAQPAGKHRGWPRFGTSPLVDDLRDMREGHDAA